MIKFPLPYIQFKLSSIIPSPFNNIVNASMWPSKSEITKNLDGVSLYTEGSIVISGFKLKEKLTPMCGNLHVNSKLEVDA